MKGAVMKVGQIASQYKDIFPPEVAQSIAKLQRQAPAVPFATIRTQVEKNSENRSMSRFNLLSPLLCRGIDWSGSSGQTA